jgi:hypothetical protein
MPFIVISTVIVPVLGSFATRLFEVISMIFAFIFSPLKSLKKSLQVLHLFLHF